MKRRNSRETFGLAIVIFMLVLMPSVHADAIIIDHTCTDLSEIPDAEIVQAKSNLHIAYQHTSHGSQLVTGMNALENFPPFGTKYEWSEDGSVGLDLDDYGIPGAKPDLSQGDYIDEYGVTPWVTATRNLLNDPANAHVNVIMWSWCSINGHNITRYLENMEILVAEYPNVDFVFMTGHAEGQGEGGFIHTANQQIRLHCIDNDRILFDFADIESYDPDENYYYDKPMWDDLDYNLSRTNNWGLEWCLANVGSELEQLTTGNGVDGYGGCGACSHSGSAGSEETINCVLKGRGTWWMMARLAGWDGLPEDDVIYVPDDYTSIQAAVNAAIAGDTIIVRDGTYYENVNVDKRLTIRSENGTSSTTVQAADSSEHVFNVTADYVNISGFTATNATAYGKAGIYLNNGVDHCNISYNNVSNNNYGVYLSYSSNNTLTGNAASDNGRWGIYLYFSNNTALVDNTASDNYHGIYLSFSSDNTLKNNTASNSSYGDGIYLYRSNDGTLVNNTASDNSHGIYLSYSENNTLANNTASDNYWGIYLDRLSNSTLANNTANANDYYGVYLLSSNNNTLHKNNASNNDDYGIYLSSSSNNTLHKNNASDNDDYGIYLSSSSNSTLANNTANTNEWYGIYLYRSNTNTLLNNTANSNKVYIGIYLSDSDDNRLIGNTADYNGWEGIRLSSSDNCTVKENNLFGNNLTDVATGLLSWASSNTVIANNTVNSNTYGIYLHEECFNNTINNNIASENNYTGITVYDSSDATICDNTANNNNGYGIFIVDSPTENITIRNNTASHNTDHGIFSTPYNTMAGPMNLTIIENTVIGNGVGDNRGYGIYLRESSEAIISDNYIADNAASIYAYGIKLYSFTNATIYKNVIVNNSDYGIMLDSVTGSGAVMGFTGDTTADASSTHAIESEEHAVPPTALALLDEDYTSEILPTRGLLVTDVPCGINITENIIVGNAGGIYLNVSDNVTMTGNNVTDNGLGINLTSSNENTIYDNYFNNSQNAADDGINTWNTTNTTGPNIIGGPFIGGNYWSDYTGNDGDGDGFGETAYNVTGGTNKDYLPLVRVQGICGDVDCNGLVNIIDVRLLLNHVNDPGGYPVDSWAGNVDGEGGIDTDDVQRLLTHVFDPVEQSLTCS